MNVRKIEEKYLEKACQIYERCFQVKIKRHHLERKTTLLGLFLEEELIGIAQIDFIYNLFEDTIIAYINSLGVDPDYQNRGYGDFFLKQIIFYSKKYGANKIQLTSNKNRVCAHHLYLKNDFCIVDTIFFKKEI